MYTSPRYSTLAPGLRPLPYAYGAGECLVEGCLDLLASLLR